MTENRKATCFRQNIPSRLLAPAPFIKRQQWQSRVSQLAKLKIAKYPSVFVAEKAVVTYNKKLILLNLLMCDVSGYFLPSTVPVFNAVDGKKKLDPALVETVALTGRIVQSTW